MPRTKQLNPLEKCPCKERPGVGIQLSDFAAGIAREVGCTPDQADRQFGVHSPDAQFSLEFGLAAHESLFFQLNPHGHLWPMYWVFSQERQSVSEFFNPSFKRFGLDD